MIFVGEASPNIAVDELLARPLFAHLATESDDGPRDSPVWFAWEDGFIWTIGNTESDTFPGRIARDPRCAIGIVDFRPETGLLQHIGFRGTAEIVPFEIARGVRLIRRYVGLDVKIENLWFASGVERTDLATTA
ncbi:MAG TPA: pyridoxamine 5'-phosphate oxidase family protein, partial [Candidatus Elarobacter sp.]